eukprot:TRINITY_DN11511_c0_g2_i1.p1 TRINITY_DN11511_c0_g2~~TRINITY_DN11511_c0_g2_i1.p1  ORF type:complete len:837 (+),score=238.83 TRINITY_DN11511_c0_g2_i1:106-2616(+)
MEEAEEDEDYDPFTTEPVASPPAASETEVPSRLEKPPLPTDELPVVPDAAPSSEGSDGRLLDEVQPAPGETSSMPGEAPPLPDGLPPLPGKPDDAPSLSDAPPGGEPSLIDGPSLLPDEAPPLPEGLPPQHDAMASQAEESPPSPDEAPPLPDGLPPLPEGVPSLAEGPPLTEGTPLQPDEPPPIPAGAPPAADGSSQLTGEIQPIAPRPLSSELASSILEGVGLKPDALGGGTPPTPSQSSQPASAQEEPKAAPVPQAKAFAASLPSGHTPESIARLPPKLRQRLVQRGILKEEDVKMAMRIAMGGGPAPVNTGSGTADSSANSASDVPPQPAAQPQPEAMEVCGEFVKATAPSPPQLSVPGPEADASFAPQLPVPGPGMMPFFAPQMPGMVAEAQQAWLQQAALMQQQQLAAARANEAWVQAMALAKMPAAGAMVKAAAPVTEQPPKAKAPAQQVYSSGPVLSQDAIKRKAAGQEAGKENTDTKRAKTEGDQAAAKAKKHLSPADARAAAAREEGGVQAPTWLYKDGKVTQAGAPGTPLEAPGTPEEPAAAPGTPPEELAEDRRQNCGLWLPPGAQATEAVGQPQPPAAPAPPTGPPLPAGWVRVPHEDDFYFWNTSTGEVSWEHPAEASSEQKKKKEDKPKFTEEHRVLWTDLGKVIGSKGMNLKIIKASIGCEVHVPKQGKGEKGGKGKGKKGKSKPKLEAMEGGGHVGRGIGDGSSKLTDDKFCTITITADTALKANGGKRCIEIMLGYNRQVERALADLGVEATMPSLEELTDGKSKKKSKDGIDPMDPASYSDAPVGNWTNGMKKPGQKGQGRLGPEPRDSKTANAERF